MLLMSTGIHYLTYLGEVSESDLLERVDVGIDDVYCIATTVHCEPRSRPEEIAWVLRLER